MFKLRIICFLILGLAAGLLPAIGATQPRPGIAVLTINAASGISKEEAELLTDRIGIELFNTGQFTVMERQQMEQILKEQGFQQSGGCTDQGCIVQMGQLLGVQQLVTGSIGKLSDLYVINMRCIDVASGKICKVVSKDIKGEIEDVVSELPDIAAAIAGNQNSVISHAVGKEPSVRARQPEKPAAPAESGPSNAPVQCAKGLYLEIMHFDQTQLPTFKLSADDWVSMNNNATDKILEGLNHCFDDGADKATPQQIADMGQCKAVVLRLTLKTYGTRPDARGQVRGTADVILNFYEGTGATVPSFRIEIIKTGDRHWGDATPLVNAFDAIGGEIRDNLDKQDYIDKLKRRLRK